MKFDRQQQTDIDLGRRWEDAQQEDPSRPSDDYPSPSQQDQLASE